MWEGMWMLIGFGWEDSKVKSKKSKMVFVSVGVDA